MADRVMMIDPPDGHAYGFPKVYDGDPEQHLDDWLRENGYPEELIDRFPAGVPCRVYWRRRSGADERSAG
ncbi:hypothetical protein [Sphingomonas sp. DT-204]|uniref:hypothetical protein n=1 Tax=Sphingomonas sp. DT-204 TaxID=3396166 RepID=UPI003F1B0253